MGSVKVRIPGLLCLLEQKYFVVYKLYPQGMFNKNTRKTVRVLQYQSGMDLERRNTRKRDLKLAMLIIKFINKIEGIFFILINIHVCVAIFFFHLMQDILLLNYLS